MQFTHILNIFSKYQLPIAHAPDCDEIPHIWWTHTCLTLNIYEYFNEKKSIQHKTEMPGLIEGK